MTTTYHNNDSGGTAYDPTPMPPIGDLYRPSPGLNPTPDALKTGLHNRSERR